MEGTTDRFDNGRFDTFIDGCNVGGSDVYVGDGDCNINFIEHSEFSFTEPNTGSVLKWMQLPAENSKPKQASSFLHVVRHLFFDVMCVFIW